MYIYILKKKEEFLKTYLNLICIHYIIIIFNLADRIRLKTIPLKKKLHLSKNIFKKIFES